MLCDFDDTLRCIYCGYVARKPRTRRQCSAPQAQRQAALTQYAAAVARWLRAGRPTRDDAETARLFAVCEACPKYDAERGACSLCGCRVSRSPWALLNKIRMATESCPKGHWTAQDAPQRDALRVGVLLPVLHVGGVESWLASLVREWTASGVISPIVGHLGSAASISPESLARIVRHCPLVTSAEIEGVVRVQSAELAAATVAAASDVVVAWSVWPDLLRRLGSVPVVGVSHGCSDWWMAGCRDLVASWVAVHEAAARPVPGPSVVIPNGIDLDRCGSRLTRNEARRRLGIVTPKVLGYVGRFSQEKRIRSIVAAAEYLPPDWSVVLVGRGQERPIESERVIVRDPVEQVGDVWRACDAAVVASDAEGYCLAAVEALAAGVPLAATRVGVVEQIGQWIEQIPQPAEPREIAAAVIRAERRGIDPQLAEWVLGQSARVMADRWADYLASVAASV